MAKYEVTIRGQMVEVDANSEAEAKMKAIEPSLQTASPWWIDDYENELLRSITHITKKE
jgi:hypothetical protein